MKKFLFTLLVLASFTVNAKEITVIATGQGKTRDFAIMDAVENAVRQTTEITVSRDKSFQQIDIHATAEYNHQIQESYSKDSKILGGALSGDGVQLNSSDTQKLTAHTQDNSKEISAKYQGSIQSYQVINEEVVGDNVRITINAVIFKEEVYDPRDYKSKSLIKKADYSLAVLPFKISKKINCLGQKVSENELNALISNAFIEKLAPSRKFNLVDRNNFDNYSNELALITDDFTLPENRVKLKNIVPADYILVGTIENLTASSKKEYIPLTGETNYESFSKLKLSYRLLETATMEIVSVGSVEKKFSKSGAFSSCYNLAELLVNKAIEEAGQKLLTDIFPDYSTPNQTKGNTQVNKPQKSRAVAPAKPVDYSLPLD